MLGGGGTAPGVTVSLPFTTSWVRPPALHSRTFGTALISEIVSREPADGQVPPAASSRSAVVSSLREVLRLDFGATSAPCAGEGGDGDSDGSLQPLAVKSMATWTSSRPIPSGEEGSARGRVPQLCATTKKSPPCHFIPLPLEGRRSTARPATLWSESILAQCSHCAGGRMERVTATPALLLALLIAIAYNAANRTVLSSQIASLGLTINPALDLLSSSA